MMELRTVTMRITTAEWIERQRRDQARFLLGRPYLVMRDETTKEQVYHPVELVDAALDAQATPHSAPRGLP